MQVTEGSKTNGIKVRTNNHSKLSKREPKLDKRSQLKCLERLGIKPKSRMAKLLNVPEHLFLLKDDGEPSFSSDSEKSLDELAFVFQRLGKENPESEVPQKVLERLPEYGLALCGEGGHVYLLFVDKQRKIIFRTEVESVWSKGNISDSYLLEAKLEEAVKLAKAGISHKKDFEYVYAGSGFPKVFTKESARFMI